MDLVREAVSEWEEKNPPPQPPLKPPTYYREHSKEMLAIKKELGCSRQDAIKEWQNRAEQVLDEDDSEYKESSKIHKGKMGGVSANHFILNGCVFENGSKYVTMLEALINKINIDTNVFSKIRIDTKAFNDLLEFIIDHSELTERLVRKSIVDLGYLWHGKPIIEWIDSGALPKGSASSSWVSLGTMAAKEIEKIGPVKFKALEIIEQAQITAVYLIDSWLKGLRFQEEEAKREAKRKTTR